VKETFKHGSVRGLRVKLLLAYSAGNGAEYG
jgi:hypothetical protein